METSFEALAGHEYRATNWELATLSNFMKRFRAHVNWWVVFQFTMTTAGLFQACRAQQRRVFGNSVFFGFKVSDSETGHTPSPTPSLYMEAYWEWGWWKWKYLYPAYFTVMTIFSFVVMFFVAPQLKDTMYVKFVQ